MYTSIIPLSLDTLAHVLSGKLNGYLTLWRSVLSKLKVSGAYVTYILPRPKHSCKKREGRMERRLCVCVLCVCVCVWCMCVHVCVWGWVGGCCPGVSRSWMSRPEVWQICSQQVWHSEGWKLVFAWLQVYSYLWIINYWEEYGYLCSFLS